MNVMRKLIKHPMEILGNKAKDAINNFMKAFPEYEIEHIVADLEVKPIKIKGSLQVKMKKKS